MAMLMLSTSALGSWAVWTLLAGGVLGWLILAEPMIRRITLGALVAFWFAWPSIFYNFPCGWSWFFCL